MSNEFKIQVSKFLSKLAESLDISESHFETARERFKSVGEWLQRHESKVAKYSPIIHPQGSFLIGTVTKPVSEKDEYDIDLVSKLNLLKNAISQKRLKDLVGEEIRSYALAHNMNSPAEEGRRCWKLNYADGVQFHMDILPAIPDDDFAKLELAHLKVDPRWVEHAIAITDSTLENYKQIDQDWPRSNPKGYAEWFKERMIMAAEPRLSELVRMEKYGRIEDVPIFEWKTPLQRAIQILKRHRDIMFINDEDDRPISIIITTLAGHAYNNESDLLETLLNIVQAMPQFVEIIDGSYWVKNPVNPAENFADKWKKHPQRKDKFASWLHQVKSDVEQAVGSGEIKKLAEMLNPRFGKQAIESALAMMPMLSGPTIILKDADIPPHIEIKSPNKPWGTHAGRTKSA